MIKAYDVANTSHSYPCAIEGEVTPLLSAVSLHVSSSAISHVSTQLDGEAD